MINSSYDHTNSVWFLRVPLAKLLCERSWSKVPKVPSWKARFITLSEFASCVKHTWSLSQTEIMYLLSSCSYQATKCKQTLIHIIQCEVSRQRLTLLIFHWRIDNLFAHANNGKLQTQNPHLILVLSLPMDQSFSPPHFCQKLNLIHTNPSCL